MKNKLNYYRKAALDFSQNIKSIESVHEIALFASVAGNDPYPSDVDICLFLKDYSDTPKIAKAKRSFNSVLNTR
jgi:predicted nucleotidyltransferase